MQKEIEKNSSLNVKMATDVHRMLKIQAATEGLQIKELIEKIVRDYCTSKREAN